MTVVGRRKDIHSNARNLGHSVTKKLEPLLLGYANVYQRRGKLLPEPCSVCHDPSAQKHHDDYGKPLLVRWLCRVCHREHRRLTFHVKQKLK